MNETSKVKNIIPSLKHDGGSLMSLGCFLTEGVGALVRVNGIMKKEDYRNIFEENQKRNARNPGIERR